MITHDLQLHILRQLAQRTEGARYTDLRPDEVENDRYNYHLQYLVRSGLVEKQDDSYRLSSSGKQHIIEVQPLDLTGYRVEKFKVAALAVVCRETVSGKQILYQKRASQPFAGNYEMVGGSIKKGESATSAAARRLREEADLVAEFRPVGTLRKIRYNSNVQIYGDIFFQVCLAYEAVGEPKSSRFGEHFWLPVHEAIAIEENEPYGSRTLGSLLRQIEAGLQPEFFYNEETYHYDIY